MILGSVGAQLGSIGAQLGSVYGFAGGVVVADPDITRARAILVQAPTCASGVGVRSASVAVGLEVGRPSRAISVRVH